jgi:hypothetical protein
VIDEQYINGTYFKRYSESTNKHLLFILTGQSMSPRAFWDFKLPAGKTHSEYFVEAGIDVILFDPIGYGKATDYYPYDRISYAKQIKDVTDTLTKDYDTKVILGYSTSTAPALCNTMYGFFDKIIIKGPGMVYGFETPIEHDEDFVTSIDNLKKSRLNMISDFMIPEVNRLSNWEESLTAILETTTNYDNGTWKVPGKIVYDRRNYWVEHREHGFDIDKVPPMIIIHGEYDYESIGDEELKGALTFFTPLFPNAPIKIVPNSTHFSMWENECATTRKYIIEYCKE